MRNQSKGFGATLENGLGVCGLAALLLLIGCGGSGSPGSPAGSSTTSSPLPISFAPNSIVFAAANGQTSTFNVDEMSVSGANLQSVESDLPDTIVLFALDPSSSGEYAIAADPTGAGLYGIYISSNLALTDPLVLVRPTYSYVSSLCVTQDGAHVVYSAVDSSGTSRLFVVPISGGTPVDYGLSDGSCVSAQNSDTIAYVAPVGAAGNDQVFLRSLSAGQSGAASQVTTDAANHTLPTFSPDGTKLAFWELSAGSNSLVVNTVGSSSPLTLPNPNAILPQAESFNSDGSSIVIAGEVASQGEILTQPANGSAPATPILTSTQLLGNYGVFWTDANGRLAGGMRGASSASRRSATRKR